MTPDLSTLKKAVVKQPQIRDFKKRRELLCTSNATVISLNGVFPQVFVLQNASPCVWALKPPPNEMKSKGSQEVLWVPHEA